MHIGRLGAALSTVILLLPAGAVAATPDPVLRRSEQLDIRRLGKVSEDERAVLRVEWHATVKGGDEVRTVQGMLDNLKHLEATMVEVNQLVRNMPVQKPAAEASEAEPPKSDGFNWRQALANITANADADDFNWRLALANVTCALLVALWWFRRRQSAKIPEAKASFAPSPEAKPAVVPTPLQISPATSPMTEPAPVAAPPVDTAASAPPIVHQKSGLATPTVESSAEEPRPEPLVAKESILAEPSPPPPAVTELESMAAAETPEPGLPAPLPVPEEPVIDFLLEEADPEVVAREDAKLKRLKITPPPEVPAEPQQTNVEATLQLAEIMLSMGLDQGAAQALIEYTQANPRHAVYHWLKLLGIYRSKGLVSEFKATAEKLHEHFNIQAGDSTTPGTGEAPTLENFSRVALHVQEIWRQPEECIAYLQHLLEDNRDGLRAGFPLSVAEEILWLIEIQKEASDTPQAAGT